MTSGVLLFLLVVVLQRYGQRRGVPEAGNILLHVVDSLVSRAPLCRAVAIEADRFISYLNVERHLPLRQLMPASTIVASGTLAVPAVVVADRVFADATCSLLGGVVATPRLGAPLASPAPPPPAATPSSWTGRATFGGCPTNCCASCCQLS